MTFGNKTVFVSAGEVSGDHYIAKVFRSLREKGFDGRFYGLCGAESREAGVECLWRSERLQLIGISEIFSSLPDIWKLKQEMFAHIMREKPAALVFVDNPDFNLLLIRRLRRNGFRGKIFYISPPSVWAWRSYRVRDLAEFVDECLPLFKFEHDFLRMSRCASLWIGHPLVEEFAGWSPDMPEVMGCIHRASPSNLDFGRIVAFLPGSRRSEIEQLYPILSEVYDSLAEKGFSPVFSVAPGLSEGARALLMNKLCADKRDYYEGPGRGLMAVSDLVVGSSGTATAEALLLEKYMVVLYKVRPLSGFIGNLLLRHLFFAIPNLLAKEIVYPEFIQQFARADAVEKAALDWFCASEAQRMPKKARMKELIALMGRPGVYDFWADRILGAL